MDKTVTEQELQHLGFLGIFKESFEIISSKKKIFSQIALAFVFPLSFIYIFQFIFTQLLFFKLFHDQRELLRENNSASHRVELSIDWVPFSLIKVCYFTMCLILSLLSTTTVVYTIASMYIGKDVNFRKSIRFVPKVWKRFGITFLWSFVVFFVFNVVVAFFIFFLLILSKYTQRNEASAVILAVFSILYLLGFVYISMVWQLASVVSVLEESCGRQAMTKAKALIKGKRKVAVGVFFVLSVWFLGIHVVYEIFFVFIIHGVASLIVGVPCFLVLVMVILFGLVIQSVLYFVCKSHHGEKIDRSLLAGDLDVIYLGRPVLALKDGNVELGGHAHA